MKRVKPFQKSLVALAVALMGVSSAHAAYELHIRKAGLPSGLRVLMGAGGIPDAKANTTYTPFDFKSLLSTTGDTTFDPNQATFSASGLPSGMALSSSGVLSGTPTVKNTAGSSFNVVATYKTKTGQQAYTLVVNGVYLEVTQIAAGGSHTCAVTTAGAAKCWGQNLYGQLGNNSTTDSKVPVAVSGLQSGVASLSGGNGHTCAVTTSDGAKCWGANSYGQLGNNSTTDSKVPVDVSGLTAGVASISAGGRSTCAITTSGGTKCWGANSTGQLGNNSTTDSTVPVDVNRLISGVASISVGFSHTCAITTAGGAQCWGANGSSGILGNGTTTTQSLVPVDVSGLTSGVASISAGGDHTCALTTSGGAKCWGANVYGQLGNGTTTRSLVPVDVSGLIAGVQSLTVSRNSSSCVVTSSGGAKCWGTNVNGQLGNNSTTQSLVPVDVFGMTLGTASISISYFHACALTTSGGAKCWGSNANGQLGNNSTTQSLVPVDVLSP